MYFQVKIYFKKHHILQTFHELKIYVLDNKIQPR
jgi:hypothetical protein